MHCFKDIVLRYTHGIKVLKILQLSNEINPVERTYARFKRFFKHKLIPL